MTRTVTSTVRVLDVVSELFHSAPELDLVFTHDRGSAFDDGVYELLRSVGGRIMPWAQLPHIACDLLITATENSELPAGDCPVLVVPHGVGFHKHVPDARRPGERVSGVVPRELLDSGRVWLAISHPDQAEQLEALHPGAAERTILVGDPCHDQLLAGRRMRERYRRALGVADGQRLVVVSSTWRDESLIGRGPALPARLLGALPVDEYRVALIMHPNVWFGHGPGAVRALQRRAVDAGLLLIPPTQGWQATLIAADLLVGDHGSVTLYGAALGLPLLLAAFGDEAVPGTPMAELGRLSPYLDPADGLRAQVDRAVANHDPDRLVKVADGAFAVPGRAMRLLRTAAYELLGLPEPAGRPPAPLAFRDPVPEDFAVTAWSVVTTMGGDGCTVDTRRFPASVAEEVAEVAEVAGAVAAPDAEPAEAEGVFVHLACDEDELDSKLAESASVLTKHRPARTAVCAARWIRDTFAHFPFGRLAAATIGDEEGPGVGYEFVVGLWDGRLVEVVTTGAPTDPGHAAAVVYARLRAGLPIDDVTVQLRIGPRGSDVALRIRPTRWSRR
ncbi:hypothetical protein [Embleya sp. AB8]|uniref:hypothetical protein n=1 Tax=Embleya sp. AB8 TaxID=3156304 RepID=UPI003C770F63